MKTSLLAPAALMLVLAPAASALALPDRPSRPTPQAATNEAEVYKMRLGTFTIVAIGDGIFELPTDQLLVDAKPGEISALLAATNQPVVQPTSVNAYLIDTGKTRILVDTGGGNFFGPALGKFMAGLRAAGYKPEDIDEILITHLHPDHVGGLAVDGKMVFPHAMLHVGESEKAFWLDKANIDRVDPSVKASFDAAALSLAPYQAAGRLQTFQPGAVLAPGIHAVALAGHTPGHTAYRVESGGRTLLIWGDVMHVAPVQLIDPAITIRFAYRPDEALRSRQRVLTEAAKRHYLVAGAHLAFPGIGTFHQEAHQWRWLPVTQSAIK